MQLLPEIPNGFLHTETDLSKLVSLRQRIDLTFIWTMDIFYLAKINDLYGLLYETLGLYLSLFRYSNVLEMKSDTGETLEAYELMYITAQSVNYESRSL